MKSLTIASCSSIGLKRFACQLGIMLNIKASVLTEHPTSTLADDVVGQLNKSLITFFFSENLLKAVFIYLFIYLYSSPLIHSTISSAV